ncbi:MAG TPA: pyruvate, phosphate dikinase, partial [Planctomycetaceae bacterium]|nr:pyruvate, phosphate dikinase [Planctomycetaceae bacterium]
ICLTAEEAERLYNLDPTDPLILVRRETSPEDLRGMRVAQGILTAFGGASSHAALVSRQMGKTCIVGCNELNVDYVAGTVSVGDTVLNVGDWISIDGFTGEVFTGEVTTKSSEIVDVLIKKTLAPEDSEAYQRYAQLMEWVDEHRTMGVRTNADQPDQAVEAVSFGAEGIGLCRTEHMF